MRLFITILIVLSQSCDLGDKDATISGNWSINKDEIISGGVAKDGIPSVDAPLFSSSIKQINFLEPGDRVIGLIYDEKAYAFPESVLDWHEIINTNSFTISYCPLTGTAVADSNTNYGVSGLLYRNNLILYDRSTDSKWSQLNFRAVNGKRIDEKMKRFTVLHTKVSTWLALYPNTEWMNGKNTTYSLSRYLTYPYGSYLTDTRTLFSIKNINNRFHKKDLVLGFHIDDKPYAISFSYFKNKTFKEFELDSKKIIIFGSALEDFTMVYSRKLGDKTLHFSFKSNTFPYLYTDKETNSVWNLKGSATSGLHTGKKLNKIIGTRAYWFAWFDFYPNTVILDDK